MSRLGCAVVAMAMVAAASELVRAQECESDEDCPMGLVCEPDGDVGVACPSDGPCTVPPITAGSCEPQPIECEVDADCPTGLSCVAQEADAQTCGVSSDGEVICDADPEPSSEPRLCAFAPVVCEDDQDCQQAGYECLLFAERERCDDIATTCPPGQECVQPEPGEATCQTETLSLCFPARRDCTSDFECVDGWACLDLSQEEPDELPPSYVGASAVCVPEGIKLLATEQIAAPSVELQSGADFGSDDNSAQPGSEGVRASGDVTPGEDGGLCAVVAGPGRARSPQRSGWSAVALAVLAASLGRRRLRLRRRAISPARGGAR